MTPVRSARTSTSLFVLGGLFVWTALIVGGAARGILRSDVFARRLAATLSDERVANYVSARITDGIISQRPNLVGVRPLLQSAVSAVVTSAPFRAVVRTTARTAHHSLFESAGRNLVLSLPDVSVLVRGALANASPDLAAKIPPGIEATLVSPEAQRAFTRFIAAWVLLGRVLWAAWVMLALGLAAGVVAIWVAPDRRTALVRAGGALFAVGLVLIAVLPAGRLVAAALTRDPALRGVVHGLWVAFFGPVKPLAVIAGSARLVLATGPGAVAAPTGRTDARAWRIVAVMGVVLAAALGGGAFLVFRAPPTPPETAGVVSVCNGSEKLCDRRVDQVVFPAAHNAMSNAEIPGWLFPHHNHAFPRQLEDGVRALLIDVHYGVPAGGHVITDMEREGTTKDKIQEVLGPEATDAALRIRSRFLGKESGASALYFCHGFCELGAYPVLPALEGVRAFLVANTGEVVLVVVEDYVTPEDLARAFQDAGLMDLIYTGPVAPPLPTLRQLIDQGQRLLVFTESGKPGVPWLRPAFESMQETPYSFHKPADFSCRPNRGGTTPPLFQINHWIETTPAP